MVSFRKSFSGFLVFEWETPSGFLVLLRCSCGFVSCLRSDRFNRLFFLQGSGFCRVKQVFVLESLLLR